MQLASNSLCRSAILEITLLVSFENYQIAHAKPHSVSVTSNDTRPIMSSSGGSPVTI